MWCLHGKYKKSFSSFCSRSTHASVQCPVFGAVVSKHIPVTSWVIPHRSSSATIAAGWASPVPAGITDRPCHITHWHHGPHNRGTQCTTPKRRAIGTKMLWWHFLRTDNRKKKVESSNAAYFIFKAHPNIYTYYQQTDTPKVMFLWWDVPFWCILEWASNRKMLRNSVLGTQFQLHKCRFKAFSPLHNHVLSLKHHLTSTGDSRGPRLLSSGKLAQNCWIVELA